MFHYKYAKHKSNYLRVTIPMGTDYLSPARNSEWDISLCQGECTLVLPLFGGEHLAVAQYEAGTIGADQLIGETIVPYTYEQGKIQVTDYDYTHHGLWAKQESDAPPAFRLLRRRADKDGFTAEAEQPLFVVSSNRQIKTNYVDSTQFPGILTEVIQNQLRTIYDCILEAIKGTGLLLSIHKEDIMKKNDAGNIVGAAFVNTVPNYHGYFYNVDGSALDNRPGGSGWLDYYDRCLINPPIPPGTPVPAASKHQYCSTNGYNNLACNTIYYGGHVLVPAGGGAAPAVWSPARNYYISGLAQAAHQIPVTPLAHTHGTPRFDQTFIYNLLPICNHHNNTHNFDVAMRTQLRWSETLVRLNCFRSNYTY